MTNSMRCVVLCFALALAAAPLPAGEGKWVPERTITIFTMGGPGGGLDAMSRVLIGPMSEYLGGATIVIENNGAAGGSVSAEIVRNAPADGYTILSVNNGIGTLAVTGSSDITYNDFDMLNHIGSGNMTFQVSAASEVKTMTDLLELMKKRPTTGSHSGVGGMPFMPEISLLSLMPEALEKVSFVPYDSGREIANAIATGEVDWGVSDVIESLGNWPSLAIPLCVFKSEGIDVPGYGRIPGITEFIDIPPELMLSGANYRAYVLKKGVPGHIRRELDAAMQYAFKSDVFQEFLRNNALSPSGLTGKEAQDLFIDISKRQSWLLYDMGYADASPEVYNIPRP